MLKRNWQFLLLSGLAVLSVAGWAVLAANQGAAGFPLDDGWIHQTYARSLAQGGGWSYFPGQPSAGATAPLWVLLLVPGYWLGVSPVCWVLLLGVVTLWLVALLGYFGWRFMGPRRGLWPLAAGLILALEWHLLWAALSGMETLFFAGLSLGVLVGLLYLQEKGEGKGTNWWWLGLGAVVGLGIWVRPEAVTLLGPVGFVAVLKQTDHLKTRVYQALLVFLGVALLFIPYLIFNRWLAGAWWPNTFFAKQAEYAILREASLFSRIIQQPTPLLAGVGAAIAPGFLISAYFAVKRRNWAMLAGWLWAVGYLVLYAIRLPVVYQHGRYIIPVMGVLALWGLSGFAEVADKPGGQLRWMVSRVWGAAIALLLLVFWFMGMNAFSTDVAVINGEMVETAGWLAANTKSEDVIAAHDIGAIGYFAPRQILDLAGLISPDVIPFIRDEAKLEEYLNQHCPQYLVTFPDWYPELVKRGELVFQTDTAITREFEQENMAVYLWMGCDD